MMLKDLKDALTQPKFRLSQAKLRQTQTCLTQANFCPNLAKKNRLTHFRRVGVTARQKSAASAAKNPGYVSKAQCNCNTTCTYCVRTAYVLILRSILEQSYDFCISLKFVNYLLTYTLYDSS